MNVACWLHPDSKRHWGLATARHHQADIAAAGATSLARLWRDPGKTADAHNLLVSVYGWFTENIDTPDPRDARELLVK